MKEKRRNETQTPSMISTLNYQSPLLGVTPVKNKTIVLTDHKQVPQNFKLKTPKTLNFLEIQ